MSLHFIFLMQAEEAAFFEGLLCGTEGNIGTCAETLEELEALALRLRRPRLIAFSTDVIVPGAVIQALGGDCFNSTRGPRSDPDTAPMLSPLRGASGTSE